MSEGIYLSDSVKILVNILRDRIDLGLQLIFNLEKLVLIVLSDEVDGETKVTKTTRATDSVEIGLRVLGEVEVYDDVHSHDIDTTGEQVSADEATSFTNLEIVINPVSVTLLHLGVDEEAGIAKLRDFLGKQLDTLGGVTEDNGLSDVKL